MFCKHKLSQLGLILTYFIKKDELNKVFNIELCIEFSHTHVESEVKWVCILYSWENSTDLLHITSVKFPYRYVVWK